MKRFSFIPLSIFFLAIIVFIGIDLASDLKEQTGMLHFSIEAFVAVIAFCGILILLRDWKILKGQVIFLNSVLDEKDTEIKKWREAHREIIAGLSVAIDKEFDRWKLTGAEKETAHLLLKGLSHKEIAAIRSCAEKTIRQQSTAIYAKSGLGGRSELAAYFLEDLLGPLNEAQNMNSVLSERL